VIEESRIQGCVEGAINSTFITLIPKESAPESLSDYIPSSFCNFVYKLISKVIESMIRGRMGEFITSEQFGFLKDRLITDAIGLVQESIHSAKTYKRAGLFLKLDLKKAYDRVSWSYLRLVLIQIGLDWRVVQWIMGCVTSASFVVLVNGSRSYFFQVGRGLRQGCPLSPLLFLLVVDSLSRLIEKANLNGKFHGFNVS